MLKALSDILYTSDNLPLDEISYFNDTDILFLERILYDISYWNEAPMNHIEYHGSSKKTRFLTQVEGLKRFLELGFIKIGDFSIGPIYGDSIENNYQRIQKLMKYDHSIESIIKYIIRRGKMVEYDIDRLFCEFICIAAYRNWHWVGSEEQYQPPSSKYFENYITYQMAIEGFCELSAYLDDNKDSLREFENIKKLSQKGKIRFGIIPIIPVSHETSIIERSKMPLAIEIITPTVDQLNEIKLAYLENTNGDISSKHYKRGIFLDIKRIIFIPENIPWPQYGLPSKSRIYYSEDLILDTSIIVK